MGRIFENRSVFPLSKCLEMKEQCPNCGQSLKFSTNNGPGINYALTLIIFFLNILWYWPIFGISYKDNSFYYFLATTTIVVIVIQPWLMRYTRILYLYFIVGYGSLNSKAGPEGAEEKKV
jgi:hypothetical protein